jgi:peptidoglycan/LPS O-acetylase OafA/YrhL
MLANTSRLREIDFLRGVAILLVLLRHRPLFDFTTRMGWIGVDLFFVLSGYLVSGLLFREYKKYGSIKPGIFLIRRGFKIYPLYYLTYIIYLIPLLVAGNVSVTGLIGDLTFTQNYVSGWGYAYEASWSLAVEEHFYITLSLILWLILKGKKTDITTNTYKNGFNKLEIGIVLAMAICFLIRVYSNVAFSDQPAHNFTMTHLRIDSLLAGVLIGYWQEFNKDKLVAISKFNRSLMYFIIIAGLVWTPFINPLGSLFVNTIGFSLLYISFGLILILFISNNNIDKKLTTVFSDHLVNIISKIGFCSYSIYLIHMAVNIFFTDFVSSYLTINKYILFALTSIISINLGFLLTAYFENYFLSVRNKFYVSRA